MECIRIPFGYGYIETVIQSRAKVELIEIPQVTNQKEHVLIENALKELDFPRIAAATSVAIVVSDLSRPVPNDKIIKALWNELQRLGMSKSKLTLFIASGMHTPATSEEIKQILGEFANSGFKVSVHNAFTSPLQTVGSTFRGVAAELNAEFLKAEIKIAIGSVQPHQIVGYSGGAKSIAIGLGGPNLITANHSLLDHPDCQMGNLNNPARKEIEEIARLAGLDFLINVVLDRNGQIAFINAGNLEQSYEQAVGFALRFYNIRVNNKKDIVIVSPGGYPKDLNLYQAQKALNPGVKILKPQAHLILVASCSQGVGNEAFLQYIKQFNNPEALITHFLNEPFKIGPHKAYLWAKKIKEHKIILVSELKPNIARQLMVQTKEDLDSALSYALSCYQGKVEVGIIPHASAVIPVL